MSFRRITILYEDSPSRGPVRGLGLHALLKSLVFDVVNGDRHQYEPALNDRS